MADLFRGPLFVNKREVPLVSPSGVFVSASLLVTTLATSALPIGAQALPPVQQFPHKRYLNGDTSRSAPPVLIREIPLTPVGETAPFVAVETRKLRYLAPDWSLKTPQLYYRTDPVTPVGESAPQFGPNVPRVKSWLPADTTRSQPVTLQAVVPAPFVPPVHFRQPRFPYFYQPADTTRGTAKTLTADVQLPVQNYQQPAPDRLRWLPDDTTAVIAAPLRTVIVAAPFVSGLDVEPARLPWLAADSSRGTPKTLYADDVPVVVTPPPIPPSGVGRVSPRVWRQGIETYLRKLEAEREDEVRAEIKQVKAQAKKAIREAEVLPPIPRIVIEQPQFQYLVARANADIVAFAEASLRAMEREIAQRQEEDDEDVIFILLH